jgi:hypothetical protein
METHEILQFAEGLQARLFAQLTSALPNMSIGAALHISRKIVNELGEASAIDFIVTGDDLVQLRLPERCESVWVCDMCGYRGDAEAPLEERCFCYHPF